MLKIPTTIPAAIGTARCSGQPIIAQYILIRTFQENCLIITVHLLVFSYRNNIS